MTQNEYIGRKIVGKPAAFEYCRGAGDPAFQIPSFLVLQIFFLVNQSRLGFVGCQISSQLGTILRRENVQDIRQEIQETAENCVDEAPEKGLGCLCNRPLHFPIELQFFWHGILKPYGFFVNLHRWRYQRMGAHLAKMLLRRGLKFHVEAEMPGSAQRFSAGIYLLKMASERFLPIVNATKDLVIRKLVFGLCLNSALPVRRQELIVEGILIGTLPNFLAIFAGKLGDLSGECVVIFDAQSVRDGGDKVRIIQWFRLVDRNLQSLQVADRFDG